MLLLLADRLGQRQPSRSEAIASALTCPRRTAPSTVSLIGWIAVQMFRANAPYALLSLSVAPLMALTTFYFSGQACKALRPAHMPHLCR